MAYLFNSIFACLATVFTILCVLLLMYGMPYYVVWLCMYGWCKENSGEIWCFRPSETSRNRPRFILELSLRRRTLVLSEVLSRSGERGSPKRELVGAWGVSLQL